MIFLWQKIDLLMTNKHFRGRTNVLSAHSSNHLYKTDKKVMSRLKPIVECTESEANLFFRDIFIVWIIRLASGSKMNFILSDIKRFYSKCIAVST